jgi:hypothetical protein
MGIAYRARPDGRLEVERVLGPLKVTLSLDSRGEMLIEVFDGQRTDKLKDPSVARMQLDPSWQERFDFDIALEDRTATLWRGLEGGGEPTEAASPPPPEAVAAPAPAPTPTPAPAAPEPPQPQAPAASVEVDPALVSEAPSAPPVLTARAEPQPQPQSIIVTTDVAPEVIHRSAKREREREPVKPPPPAPRPAPRIEDEGDTEDTQRAARVPKRKRGGAASLTVGLAVGIAVAALTPPPAQLAALPNLPPKIQATLALRAANALARRGDVEGAIRSYRAIVEKHPDAAVAFRNLAVAYAQNDDGAAALQAYQRYVALSDDADEIARVKALLAEAGPTTPSKESAKR